MRTVFFSLKKHTIELEFWAKSVVQWSACLTCSKPSIQFKRERERERERERQRQKVCNVNKRVIYFMRVISVGSLFYKEMKHTGYRVRTEFGV
jgi:hypothetical protein